MQGIEALPVVYALSIASTSEGVEAAERVYSMTDTTDLSSLAKQLGARGGNKTKERGRAYYQEIGRRGGQKTKQRNRAYFSAIGRLGAKKRWHQQTPEDQPPSDLV